MSLRSARVLAAVVALVLVAAACGGDEGTGSLHADRGVRTIEDIVAPQMGLGPLRAECDAPDGLGLGDTFRCTARTEDDQEIVFLARVADGAVVEMLSLNVLTPRVVEAIQIAATDVLVVEQGLDLADGALRCGEATVRFDPDDDVVLDCELLHPNTGAVHRAEVTVLDLAEVDVAVSVAAEGRATVSP